ncbi:MAG: hypothetical protein FWH29_06655 [Methanobrevibacter sp.]|nr:hypothetical protein [Methanobrevibacter sp.]
MKKDPILNTKYFTTVLLPINHNYRFLIMKHPQTTREKFTEIGHIDYD